MGIGSSSRVDVALCASVVGTEGETVVYCRRCDLEFVDGQERALYFQTCALAWAANEYSRSASSPTVYKRGQEHKCFVPMCSMVTARRQVAHNLKRHDRRPRDWLYECARNG